ncbi:hypothetical protein [Paractinoplanes lichenicola]|uniref:Uncharacterized protein n=1 Tax=Paractinoplanes lichenicola TaxID=2802976 RepID=A0ABS1VY63_9ACTN|nr:hypothetical protein [Actinoplanes lichenicola]MBL7259425.1 hypothetical protein [Actinoplanes lichenicola]
MEQAEREAPVRRGLWRSKTFVTGFAAVAVLGLVAVLAPVLTAAAGQDVVGFDIAQIDPMTGLPVGGFSGEHWLGVEPLTGRDVFARVVHSLRFSLGLALAAAVVVVLVGLLAALAVRRGNGRGLLGPALMYGALLVPLILLVEVWLTYRGTVLRSPPAPSWGGMLADAAPFFPGYPAYLLVPGLLLAVTVLSFLLLAEGLRRRYVA